MKKDYCKWLCFPLVLMFLAAGGIQSQSFISEELAALTKELVSLEDQWTEAFIKHDPSMLVPIIAEDFESIGTDGRVWTKDKLMERVKEQNYEQFSFTIVDAKAKRHGDTAILYGMAIDKGKEDGKEYSNVLRFQDVWVNRDGRWQCIAGQNTPAEREMPITTFSSKARELFIQGRDKLEDYDPLAAAPLFEQAAALDSNFALAYCYRSVSGGEYQVFHAYRLKANAHAGMASLGEQLLIQCVQAGFDGDQLGQKKCLDKLISLYPHDKRRYRELGDYFIGISDYTSAINHYKKALEIDKEFAQAYTSLVYPYMQLGDYSAAETALKEYIRLRPDRSDPYDTYGYLLCKTGRHDESIAQYQKALELSDQSPWSAAGIGANYLFKGDYEKAREYFRLYQKKSSRISNKLGALFLGATSYLYEGNLSAARKIFAERRILAKKENQQGYMINSIIMDGIALAAMGKPSDGVKKLDEGMAAINQADLRDAEKDGFRTWVESCYVYAYAQSNRLDQAKAHAAVLEKAIKRRNNPGEKDFMPGAQAQIDMAEKKYDAVIAGLTTVQPDPYSYFMMGQAALSLGNKQAAKEYYKKVVDWNEFSFNQAVVWNRVHDELKKLGE